MRLRKGHVRAYRLKKFTEIEAYLLADNKVCDRLAKNKTTQYNHKLYEYKSNNISSY